MDTFIKNNSLLSHNINEEIDVSKSYIGYFDFDGLSTTIDNTDEWVKLNTNTTSVL